MTLSKFDWVLEEDYDYCASSIEETFVSGPNGDYVILLHDLLRSNDSMNKFASYLAEKNFIVFNCNYYKKRTEVEEIYKILFPKFIKKYCSSRSKKVHVIAHSYGAYLILNFLYRNKFLNIGKVILIDPMIENKGKRAIFYKFFFRRLFPEQLSKNLLDQLLYMYDINIICFGEKDAIKNISEKYIIQHKLDPFYIINPTSSNQLIRLASDLIIKK